MGNAITTRFAFSRLAQTAYGTPTGTSTSAYAAFPCPSRESLAGYQHNVNNDKGHATGVPDVTDQWSVSHSVNLSIPMQTSSYWIGYWLHKARGTVTTDQPDATTAPTAYRHRFARQDYVTNAQLPCVTFVEHIADVHRVRYGDLVVQRLALDLQGVDRITTNVELVGSGHRVSPSGLTALPAFTPLRYFHNSQTNVVFDPDDAAAIDFGLARRLRSAQLALVNTLDTEGMFVPGAGRFQVAGDFTSGSIGSRCLLTDTTWELSVTYDMTTNEPAFQWLQNQTDLAATITIQGATIAGSIRHSLEFAFPRMRIQNVAPTTQANRAGVTVTAQIFYDFDDDTDCTITLINETESYTT